MKKISRTIEIKAPAQRVYDWVSQPTNLISIWPNMQSVSNVVPSTGGAHDFDWVFKMAGFTFKGHCKTEEAKSGKLVRFRNESGIPSTFFWKYEGLNGSITRLSLDVEYTIPAPIVGKIAEALVAKMNERDLDVMLANLKDMMESTTSVGVGAHAH